MTESACLPRSDQEEASAPSFLSAHISKIHASGGRKSEQTLKELKDLNSHMNGVWRIRLCPRGNGETSISCPHCLPHPQEGPDRKTDMHWGTDSPTPEALLERVGVGVPAPTGFHTSVQGLRASQYFPLFYLKLELLFCLFDKSNCHDPI